MDLIKNVSSNIIGYTEDEVVKFLFDGFHRDSTLESLHPFKSGRIRIDENFGQKESQRAVYCEQK